MPSIPALPPTEGLTFAERVSTPAPLAPERPRTAPPKPSTPVSITALVPPLPPPHSHSPNEVSLSTSDPTRIPPPPLPLVLRPPLRKKKSFSSVSNWLFPGQESRHSRAFSQDSVTNSPRPLKDSEGFYQCVAPTTASGSGRGWGRMSFETISSISSWKTDSDPEDGSSLHTGSAAITWSLNSGLPSGDRTATATPTGSYTTGMMTGGGLTYIPQRSGTFGSKHGHRRESVGVAY